jgi:hypothetical protein
MAKKRKKKREPRLIYSRELTLLYQELNQKYFDGKCPAIEIFFQRMASKTMGHTRTLNGKKAVLIAINSRYKGHERIVEETLLHEMVHAAHPTWDHGANFRRETRRLILAGALDDIL